MHTAAQKKIAAIYYHLSNTIFPRQTVTRLFSNLYEIIA